MLISSVFFFAGRVVEAEVEERKEGGERRSREGDGGKKQK